MNVPRYRKSLVYFKDMEAGVLEESEKGFRFTYKAKNLRYLPKAGSIS